MHNNIIDFLNVTIITNTILSSDNLGLRLIGVRICEGLLYSLKALEVVYKVNPGADEFVPLGGGGEKSQGLSCALIWVVPRDVGDLPRDANLLTRLPECTHRHATSGSLTLPAANLLPQ